MKILNLDNIEKKNRCIAFGNFDGIHLGHKAILTKLKEIASLEKIESAIVCFDYSKEVKNKIKLLSTNREKEMLLENAGIENTIFYNIERPLSDENIESFINNILCKKLGAKIIVAGENNKYINILRESSKKNNFQLFECKPVYYKAEIINSQKIVSALSAGLLTSVNKMLGHKYFIAGKVMQGKGLGRTVGLPTANIAYLGCKMLPADGVYESFSRIHGKEVKGLTNIGRRPSVDDDDSVTIETFFLNFSQNIYGEEICLELHTFIREVMKFSNLEQVKLQVDKDIEFIESNRID